MCGRRRAVGRAHRDQVTRLQRQDLGEVRDRVGDREDHVVSRVLLHDLAVDFAAHRQPGAADRQLIWRHQPWADGRGVLERLALQELGGASLPVACADVVEDRVPGDMIEGRLGHDVPAAPADDDGELDLPVHLLDDGGHLDLVTRADQ